jgi:hypothetical protein
MCHAHVQVNTTASSDSWQVQLNGYPVEMYTNLNSSSVLMTYITAAGEAQL